LTSMILQVLLLSKIYCYIFVVSLI